MGLVRVMRVRDDEEITIDFVRGAERDPVRLVLEAGPGCVLP